MAPVMAPNVTRCRLPNISCRGSAPRCGRQSRSPRGHRCVAVADFADNCVEHHTCVCNPVNGWGGARDSENVEPNRDCFASACHAGESAQLPSTCRSLCLCGAVAAFIVAPARAELQTCVAARPTACAHRSNGMQSRITASAHHGIVTTPPTTARNHRLRTRIASEPDCLTRPHPSSAALAARRDSVRRGGGLPRHAYIGRGTG